MPANFARLCELGDTLADNIGRFLKNYSPKSRCERVWSIALNTETFQTWSDEDRTFSTFVVPLGYRSEVMDRGADEAFYDYGLMFCEHYSDQGSPSTSWLDDRMKMAIDVVDEFGEVRDPMEGEKDGPRAESAEFIDLLNETMLQELKLYYGDAKLTFKEVVNND